MLRGNAAAVALGLLAALTAAAPAHGEDRIARAFVGDIGFAGRDVAYELRAGDDFGAELSRNVHRVVRRRPGRPARVVARLGFSAHSEGGEQLSSQFDWDTSASSVLFSRYETHDYPGGPDFHASVFGGTFAQRLRRFADCEGVTSGASVAVWDELGAYEDVCRRDDRIVVRRLDDSRAPPAFVPVADLGRVDIAGDYVASGSPSRIEVFDRRDGRRVWSADVDLFRGADALRAAAFDLQPDGKVAALLRQHDEKCQVAWFSPTEPRPHVIGDAACHRGGVRMRGDRVAWMARRRLLVAGLTGEPRPIARFRIRADASTARGTFGFDGSRLAYGVARCDGRTTVLLRHKLAGPVWPDQDPVPCPVRAVGRTAPASVPRRVARVRVSCPRGCHGLIRVRDVQREQGFSARPGSRRIRLALDRRTVRELKRRGTSLLALSLRWIDRDGRFGPDRLFAVHLRRAS
ncbi:MAG: hypothetical protein QOG63_1492 [Thermoleophilaceae bacterium]|nr:hypothetical protein [Thermoleophilaceae bacterium]